MYNAQKTKGLLIKLKYQKISGINLKKRCIDSKKKKSNDMMCMKPNKKLQNYVIKFI